MAKTISAPLTKANSGIAAAKQRGEQQEERRIFRPDRMNVKETRSTTEDDMARFVNFAGDLMTEFQDTLDLLSPDPCFQMTLELMRRHLQAMTTTPTLLIKSSGVPYATASRRLQDMMNAGLIDRRPRTKSGKSFTLHPSKKLLEQWHQLSQRMERLVTTQFRDERESQVGKDYFFGSSYLKTRSIPPLPILGEPLTLVGGVRVLTHGDPTFMMMENLKQHFEQAIGCRIQQRAFSIDRLYEESIHNAQRKRSNYDIIAFNLPWIGELAEKRILMPLDQVMDISRLDPADFHPASWQAAHWGEHCYGVPVQTTPELLFFRRDLLAEKGLTPPATTDELLEAAKALHDPQRRKYGIAWNAARGTALGHTFLMTMADFGQPVLDLAKMAGGYDTRNLNQGSYRATIDTEAGYRAACFLLELIRYSPPEIFSMSWYERLRCYAAGNAAMAYGFTQMVPYFEQNEDSPASGQTGYLPHPSGSGGAPIAPVGGYLLGIPTNLPAERIPAAVEALALFTSPQAQKLYIQNGSRGSSRDSVGDDPDVRRISPIFEVVDIISQRDEMQCWPRPPVPEIGAITQICGVEIHSMLRGVVSAREALRRAQEGVDRILQDAKLISQPPGEVQWTATD